MDAPTRASSRAPSGAGDRPNVTAAAGARYSPKAVLTRAARAARGRGRWVAEFCAAGARHVAPAAEPARSARARDPHVSEPLALREASLGRGPRARQPLPPGAGAVSPPGAERPWGRPRASGRASGGITTNAGGKWVFAVPELVRARTSSRRAERVPPAERIQLRRAATKAETAPPKRRRTAWGKGSATSWRLRAL
jgi:hypothetical protein